MFTMFIFLNCKTRYPVSKRCMDNSKHGIALEYTVDVRNKLISNCIKVAHSTCMKFLKSEWNSLIMKDEVTYIIKAHNIYTFVKL